LRAAIFLNGFPDPPDLLRSVAGRADLVVAADGGARYALDAGVVPDLVVGDMDSLGEVGARVVAERGALLIAAGEREATDVDLVCATGGNFSSVFAVPHILLTAERMGLRATMRAGWGQVFVLETGTRTVSGDPGDSVSIFPLTGPAAGVTLEGFSYPLEDARLEIGDTLGFHNELVGGAGRVSVEEGSLLIIHETL
jgi:thiamine pyrophosphokinase